MTGTLSDSHDLADQVEIFDQMLVRELKQEARALPQLRLEHGGHATVRAQCLQMQLRQAIKLAAWVVDRLDLLLRRTHEAVEGEVDGRHQDLFFVLKVEIDGAVCHVSAARDVAHTRVEETVLREDGDGGFQDAMLLPIRGIAFRTLLGMAARPGGPPGAGGARSWSGASHGMNTHSATLL